MQLTDEQSSILSLANDSSNLQIVAYAGCGKTSTLVMLANAMAPGPKLCLAFNKKIAEDMQKGMPSTVECRTLNSLGHRVWQATIPKRVTLNTKKTLELFREVVKGYPKDIQRVVWDEYQEISTAVAMAKAVGYIPIGVRIGKPLIDYCEFWPSLEDQLSVHGRMVCEAILNLSIKTAYEGNLDYNDQLYMPALFGGSFPRFPVVMVDEYQDLSPVNHAMIAKLAKQRLVGVGDPFQSIYGFRGAKQGGMEHARQSFTMEQRPLSISFRCPSEIVKNARWRVPGFNWHKVGGRVDRLERCEAMAIPEGSAIICRNNAPLFRTALNLISAGRSVSVAGTDIGPKLTGILKRLGPEDLPRSAVLYAIQDWMDRRSETSKSAPDLAECMRVLASNASTLGETLAYAEFLFKQTGSIHLSTGHKAKGLEWDTVYHLDPWLIRDGEQEDNLKYVIQTRAREAYFEINSKEISYE